LEEGLVEAWLWANISFRDDLVEDLAGTFHIMHHTSFCVDERGIMDSFGLLASGPDAIKNGLSGFHVDWLQRGIRIDQEFVCVHSWLNVLRLHPFVVSQDFASVTFRVEEILYK